MVRYLKGEGRAGHGRRPVRAMGSVWNSARRQGQRDSGVRGANSAQALSYGANGADRVCAIHADGHGVATCYFRVNGAGGRLADSGGNGTCTETSDIPSNPVAYVNACVNISGTDRCTGFYVATGR